MSPYNRPIRRAAACAIVAFMAIAAPALSRSDRPEFRAALPGYRFAFPRDHGTHPDFKTEWWYFTGNLSASGRPFGFELTFFRRGVEKQPANPSRWAVRDLYLAHFAISDIQGKRFLFAERISRSGLGQAGAAEGRLNVWIDSSEGRWAAEWVSDGIRLEAADPIGRITLLLRPKKRPVLHGSNGLSKKGEGSGRASHYYSLTRLDVEGTLTTASGSEEREFPVSGEAWMDHEFSTDALGPDQTGWDWFSLQMDDGSEMMLYRIRRLVGEECREETDPASGGTFVFPDGRYQAFSFSEVAAKPLRFWKSAKSGGNYPIGWRLSIPTFGFEGEVTPLLADQELRTEKSTRVTYWEGAVTLNGSRRGRGVSGKGYLELVGYASPTGAIDRSGVSRPRGGCGSPLR